jgi:hypothetical protein
VERKGADREGHGSNRAPERRGGTSALASASPALRRHRRVGQWRIRAPLGVLGRGTGNGEWGSLSGTYHVHYDAFLVPGDAVAVFEVSLGIYYTGYKGSESVDFQIYDFESLLCPYVELEALTEPLLASG